MSSIDNTRHSKPLGILLFVSSRLCDPMNSHKEKGQLKQNLEADERGKPRIVRRRGILHQDIAKQIAIPRHDICENLWIEGPKEALSIHKESDGNVRQKVAEKGRSGRSLQKFHCYELLE